MPDNHKSTVLESFIMLCLADLPYLLMMLSLADKDLLIQLVVLFSVDSHHFVSFLQLFSVHNHLQVPFIIGSKHLSISDIYFAVFSNQSLSGISDSAETC